MDMKFRVRLLGRLEISDGQQTLTEDGIRSDMVTKLLAYLLLNHDHVVSLMELASILWPNEESDNPAGALKNLVYRLRKSINKCWPQHEFIVTGRASYQWNPNIKVQLDCEEMLTYIRRAADEADVEKRIDLLDRASKLYEGRLLESFSSDYYFMGEQAQFHNRFLSATKELAELLEEQGRFSQLEDIASRAISLDPMDDQLHCCLLKAYIGQNEVKKAEEHYRRTAKMFYDRLGVNPSEELTQIYDRLMVQEHRQETDLSIIQRDLEEQEITGAFYCEYGVFKKVYELEARREKRLGLSIYLSLITLEMEPGLSQRRGNYFEVMSDAMDKMQDTVLSYLRSGDVVTRYSNNQFLIMLPGCNYENAKMVMRRLQDGFMSRGRRSRVTIQYSLKEMSLSS